MRQMSSKIQSKQLPINQLCLIDMNIDQVRTQKLSLNASLRDLDPTSPVKERESKKEMARAKAKAEGQEKIKS